MGAKEKVARSFSSLKILSSLVNALITSIMGGVTYLFAFFFFYITWGIAEASSFSVVIYSNIPISWGMLFITFNVDLRLRRALWGKDKYPELQATDNKSIAYAICLSSIVSIVLMIFSSLIIWEMAGEGKDILGEMMVLFGVYFYIIPMFIAHQAQQVRWRKQRELIGD